MKGKIITVTGANLGVGKETVLGLAPIGATGVMVCRRRGRGESERAEIVGNSGNEDVELMIAGFQGVVIGRCTSAACLASPNTRPGNGSRTWVA